MGHPVGLTRWPNSASDKDADATHAVMESEASELIEMVAQEFSSMFPEGSGPLCSRRQMPKVNSNRLNILRKDQEKFMKNEAGDGGGLSSVEKELQQTADYRRTVKIRKALLMLPLRQERGNCSRDKTRLVRPSRTWSAAFHTITE